MDEVIRGARVRSGQRVRVGATRAAACCRLRRAGKPTREHKVAHVDAIEPVCLILDWIDDFKLESLAVVPYPPGRRRVDQHLHDLMREHDRPTWPRTPARPNEAVGLAVPVVIPVRAIDASDLEIERPALTPELNTRRPPRGPNLQGLRHHGLLDLRQRPGAHVSLIDDRDLLDRPLRTLKSLRPSHSALAAQGVPDVRRDLPNGPNAVAGRGDSRSGEREKQGYGGDDGAGGNSALHVGSFQSRSGRVSAAQMSAQCARRRATTRKRDGGR
jgi:hypothetical protein